MYSDRNRSYSSPSKLWRQIQTLIRTNNEQAFERLCNGDRAPHMAHVLLSQLSHNETTMASASDKYHILQLSSALQPQHYVRQLFGPSCQDLNALQMALFLRHEIMARSILRFLQHFASHNELLEFVNHPWGHDNSSLHLAAFLGMEKLVELLLECGADTTHRNTRQYDPLEGCTKPACIQLLQQAFYSPASTTINNNNDHTIIKQGLPIPSKESSILATDLPQTSMLLKKAVQQSMVRKDIDMTTKFTKLPLLLSTSTSSTSSYSSLSSLEEPLSPSTSNQRFWISSLSPPPSPTKSSTRQYGYCSNRRIYNLPISCRHRYSPLPPSSSNDKDDYEISKSNNTTGLDSVIRNDQPIEPISPSSSPRSVRFSPEFILLDVCMRGDIEDLMDLIKQQQQQHAKPVSVLLQEWQDQHATPILSLALLYQQEPMAKCLVTLGVDVNATDPDGWAPLHYAATLQLWSSVALLAHHPGINLNAKTNNGLKAYDCPRTMTDQRRCRLLIDRAKTKTKQNKK